MTEETRIKCGREVTSSRVNFVTAHHDYYICNGTVVPVNTEKTAWKCTGCGNVTKADECVPT